MRAGRQEGGKKRKKSKGKPEWKKLALTAREAELLELACERLKVSLIFPTITPLVFLLVLYSQN